MVMKIPANRYATSWIGNQLKPLSSRIFFDVVASDSSPMMMRMPSRARFWIVWWTPRIVTSPACHMPDMMTPPRMPPRKIRLWSPSMRSFSVVPSGCRAASVSRFQ